MNLLTGSVCVVGKSNVGKSTLINNLLKKDECIICNKPQTTRDCIKKFYQDDESYIKIFDSPGIHKPFNKLDEFLNEQAKKSIKLADKIIFVFDISTNLDQDDLLSLNLLKENFKNKPILCLLNKVDLISNDYLEDKIKIFLELGIFEQIIPTSFINNIHRDYILEWIKKDLKKQEIQFFIDSKQDDIFTTKEIIRLICLNNLQKEIPHGIAIIIDEFKYIQENNKLDIYATIIAEKTSHKKIIIGNKGSMIKQIGIESRKKLLEFFDCSINLKLFVKIEPNWRNNNYLIQSFGYK